ncbi:hypothetical protein K2X96_01545 [Patescibacteria group bacterium]|nr:hypothetical protein [Patescibacteria group bacterium]
MLQAQLATLQKSSTANGVSGLTISLSKLEAKSNSAQVSWITSISAESKVIISKSPISSSSKNGQREISSNNGTSTKGFADIKNLEQDTKYYYLIKATAKDSDVQLNGTFTTPKSAEQIAKEKRDELTQKNNLQKQASIIKELKAIDDECSPSGCDYGLRYQQEWNQLISELKAVGGSYEGSCLFDLVGNRSAISSNNRHLSWQCVGWGG